MISSGISVLLKGFEREFSTVSLIFGYFWQLFLAWWWLPLPFLLQKPFLYFWKWWRLELFLKKQRMILLEVKIPEESLKPIRAMEDVFSGLWQGFYDPPNFWEEWWDGKIIMGLSLETVSLGGEVHFYVRCSDYRRDTVETNIYSQYPEAEITVAEDYTRSVPQDMPNKDWDMWSTDYKLDKPNPYPIKTYKDFETESEKEEEKRVDPVAMLLEWLAKVKPGEQFWLQIQATPISEKYAEPFWKEGEAFKEKLSKRPEKPKQKPIWRETADATQFLITGKEIKEEKSEKFELIAPELRLTPGEKEIVAAVERKIAKPPWLTSVRWIWLGKKEVWFKGNLRLGLAFLGHYVTENLNALFPMGQTITKVYSRPPFNILDRRRVYLRKRKIFRLYRERFRPMFPKTGNRKTGTFILNNEELASLYHFPSRAVAPAPAVPRVGTKKGEAPSELPVE